MNPVRSRSPQGDRSTLVSERAASNGMNSKAQIMATIGPATESRETICKMIEQGMAIARLNFSWGTHAEHAGYIKNIREAAKEYEKIIPIVQDLSGPRIQDQAGHRFNAEMPGILTDKDLVDLKFGIKQNIDYVAMSFIGSAKDIFKLREKMAEFGKIIPIIAKVEREIGVLNIDEIIKASDAVMVARGDLGNEIPLEQIPFVQKDMVAKCKLKGKPAIVATEMMLSMMKSPTPVRSDVTDVAYAILNGADCVMLSEETAIGKYPVETVGMIQKIIIEAERHTENFKINSL